MTGGWGIIAVCKHICPDEALTGAFITIGVNKPSCCRVIISALQVIEARLGIIIIATIAKRVFIGHGARLREDVAPRVVLIGCYGTTGGSDQLYDIALEIEDVVIRDEAAAAVGRVVQRKWSAGFVIDEIHNVGDAAVCFYRFPRDFSVQGQVFVGDSLRRNQRLTGMGGLRFGGIFGCIGSIRGIIRLSHILRLKRL